MNFAFLKFMMTRYWLLALTACALLLASAGCGDAPSTATQTQTPSGKSAPSRTNMSMPPADVQTRAARGGQRGWTLLDNRHMQLSDYLGQVVVLDFWATYCPPCLEEAPHLVELQRRYGPQGLHIIGINVGGPEDQPEVPGFVEKFKISYMLGYPDAGTTELYLGDDTRIPQTLVFDRKGKLVKHFVGYDPQVSADLNRAIETALNAPAD